MKIDWKIFTYQFKNWVRRNTFRPNSVARSFQVMRNAMFLVAPHTTQPAFEKLFGPIDPKFLTSDVQAKCSETRDKFVDSCRTSRSLDLDPRIVQQAIDLTNEGLFLTGKKFRPASIYAAAERLPGETNSGAPDYARPKRDELPKVIGYLESVEKGVMTLPQPKYFWPITVFWRSQMRESGVKHRIIAAFPQLITVLEMKFALPFFEHFEQLIGQTWYSYGSKWYHNAEVWSDFQKYPNVIEIDYDTFDQSVHGKLIFLFYENLKAHLLLDELDMLLLEYVRDYHILGNVLTSYRGEPYVIEDKVNSIMSGSVFTSFADSWINRFILNYTSIAAGYSVSEMSVRVMGDDTLIGTFYDGSRMLETFRYIIKHTFGMTVGPKSVVVQRGQPLYYMGFLFTDNFKYMSEDLMSRKMTFTGRFIPETSLDNRMVVWSKFCSICSVCSNGFDFWTKHKDKLLGILGIEEPTYFHDLTEGDRKSVV